MRTSLRRLLQRAGWVALEAERGTAALQLLRATPVASSSPISTCPIWGIERIAAARGMLPDIPIAAMSGDSPERFASLLDASLLGVVVTLQKPFTSATMLAALGLHGVGVTVERRARRCWREPAEPCRG